MKKLFKNPVFWVALVIFIIAILRLIQVLMAFNKKGTPVTSKLLMSTFFNIPVVTDNVDYRLGENLSLGKPMIGIEPVMPLGIDPGFGFIRGNIPPDFSSNM